MSIGDEKPWKSMKNILDPLDKHGVKQTRLLINVKR